MKCRIKLSNFSEIYYRIDTAHLRINEFNLKSINRATSVITLVLHMSSKHTLYIMCSLARNKSLPREKKNYNNLLYLK